MSAEEVIAQRVEQAGTSFYWAMRLLPAERRNAITRGKESPHDDTKDTKRRRELRVIASKGGSALMEGSRPCEPGFTPRTRPAGTRAL